LEWKNKSRSEYINGKLLNYIGYNYKRKKDFEIKNGKGSGKPYYFDGKLIFEGEYLNVVKNGKCK